MIAFSVLRAPVLRAGEAYRGEQGLSSLPIFYTASLATGFLITNFQWLLAPLHLIQKRPSPAIARK